MENTTTKMNNTLSAVLAVLVILAGGALLGYSLYMLPEAPAYGFPWALLGVVASLLPVAAGSGWLGSLFRRRDGFAYDHNGAVMFGIMVITAGVVLLCFNFGALPLVWRKVIFSWQMLLILFGMVEFSKRHIVGGSVLLAVGAFFIIRKLAPIYPDIEVSGIGSTFWPVLLIVLGILVVGSIVFRPCRSRRNSNGRCDRRHIGVTGDGKRDTSGFSATSGIVDIKVVFGGNEQVYLDPVFQGGQISSVFGGVMLDLRRTELPEGVTYLKVEAVFGGVEIYAPEGWDIDIRNESFFGGFVDKRFYTGARSYTDGRKLVIRASNVFGGGEIK